MRFVKVILVLWLMVNLFVGQIPAPKGCRVAARPERGDGISWIEDRPLRHLQGAYELSKVAVAGFFESPSRRG